MKLTALIARQPKIPAALLLLALTAGGADFAHATPTLTVNETQPLDFATLAKPGSSQTLTVSALGSASGSGTILYNTVLNGNYTILSTGGTPPPTIEIDIANVGGGSGFTLSNFTGLYDGNAITFPAVGLSTPDGAPKTLKIGATVTYNSSVNVGQFSPTFDIVVNYE